MTCPTCNPRRTRPARRSDLPPPWLILPGLAMSLLICLIFVIINIAGAAP